MFFGLAVFHLNIGLDFDWAIGTCLCSFIDILLFGW